MAVKQIRNGTASIEQAEFTKSHGVTPSRATIKTDRPAAYRIDDILWITIGTSQWMGRCVDVRESKNESEGRTTQVAAVDFRDDLFSVTVFGQINMLDQETGEVYSIIEGVPDPADTEVNTAYEAAQASLSPASWPAAPPPTPASTSGLAGLKGQFQTMRQDIVTFRDKLSNDLVQRRNAVAANGGDESQLDTYQGTIPELFRNTSPNAYILQTPYHGRVPVGVLIEWLAAVCGFRVKYSSESRARINMSDNADWDDSRWNVFNLDWGTGIKVSSALTQVLDALGLQVTMKMDWTRTLYVTKVGEVQYPGLIWEGKYATDTDDGVALQDDADTGVWIVGDRDIYEFWDLPYRADWNEVWNELFWDVGKLKEFAKENSLDLRTARVRDCPGGHQEFTQQHPDSAEVATELLDLDKYLNGKNINDMLVTEYIRTVPYRLYRILGMDKVLTLPSEYSGELPPREVPIATPLLEDPNVQAILESHWVDEELLATLYVQRVAELSAQEKGWTLIENTGQIWFDEPRFQYTAEADTLLFDELLPEHMIAEEGTITVSFYGPVYRKFFGTNKRVGSLSVSGLRKGFVLTTPDALISTATEHVYDGARSADITAEDIATAYLARPRVVRSGSEKFVGTSGHEVSGEIQRVTVSVDESSGITENVQYANDEPSPSYDPQIELRNRLTDKAKTWASARLATDRRDNKLKELFAAVDKMDPSERKTGKELRDKHMMRMGAATSIQCSNTT